MLVEPRGLWRERVPSGMNTGAEGGDALPARPAPAKPRIPLPEDSTELGAGGGTGRHGTHTLGDPGGFVLTPVCRREP